MLVYGGRLWLDHAIEPAPTNWPYVTFAPGRAAGVMYEQYNACGGFGSVFFEVRLGHGGGTLVFPGELGGRCDSREALPWMNVSVFFRS